MISGKQFEVDEKPERLGKDFAYLMSGAKLEVLGFKSSISIEDGLREMWEAPLAEERFRSIQMPIDQDNVSVG